MRENDNYLQNNWVAQFVWLPKSIYPNHQKVNYTYFSDKTDCNYCLALFRKSFSISKNVVHAVLKTSACVKYRLYVNETFIGRGPIMLGGDYGNTDMLDYWFYDNYDISTLLNENNCICFDVSLRTDIQADYSFGNGGLAFELSITYEDGSIETIISDEKVKCEINTAFERPEMYNAISDKGDWIKIWYNDRDWTDSELTQQKELLLRPIPNLYEEEAYPQKIIVYAEQYNNRIMNHEALLVNESSSLITFGCPVTFTLDFGIILSGRIHIKLDGVAGTNAKLHLCEIEGKIDSSYTYVMKDGYQEYEFFNLSSVRYLIVTISNITKQIEINSIFVKFSCYPVKEEGTFACSDSLLNDVYEAGKYSLKMCRQDYHMDSPIHQEALGCTGDYMIESLVNYYAFYDSRLTRLDIWRTAQILHLHNGFFFHTSYSLLFAQMVWDYYMFTGDSSILNEVEESLDILINRFYGYIGEFGVIEKAPNYMFMDWVPQGNYNLHHPPRTIGQGYMTAMFIRALENCAKIKRVMSKEDKATEFIHQSNKIKEAFHKLFWNEDKGLYCDGVNNTTPTVSNDWLPADIEGIFYSQHTNSLAVFYNIAPEEYKTEIMEKVVNDTTLTQAQPYFMHFVIEAIYEANLFEKYGLQQIRRWEKLLYECRSSLKEVWFGFDCDYSHAWGGTPTYQLPSKVLGIRPLKPGFSEVEINPILGSLEFANGEVITPLGKIKVEYTNNGKYYKADIEIPEKIKVKLGHVMEVSEVNIKKI